MNNKLVCPFCGEELEDAGIHSPELYFCCTNCYMKQKEKDDNYTASPIIWQALIQAKQDLQTAVQALKKIESTEWYDSMSSYEIMTFTAMKALEQIEHKEI